MWNRRKAEPQHEFIEDINSSDLDSPSREQSEFRGYIDPSGNPNPVFVSSGDADEESSMNDQNQRRLELWIDFISDLSFLFGTFLYLWLTLSENKDVLFPNENLDENDGKTNTKPGWLLHDMAISEGFSSYMLYGIVSGILILAAGAFRLYTSRSRSDRIPYAFMVVASILAIVSSSLISKEPFGSKVCFSISVHGFALQAATLILWRISRLQYASRENRIGYFVRILADFMFLLSTLGGITLSYWYLFDATDVLSFRYEYLDIGAAGLWCLSSLLYLLCTFSELISRGVSNRKRNRFNGNVDEKQGPRDSLPMQGTQSTDEKTPLEEAIQAMQEKLKSRVNSNDLRRDLEAVESNDSDLPFDEEKSVFTTWTDGPGPSDKELIAKSSLDNIFGASF